MTLLSSDAFNYFCSLNQKLYEDKYQAILQFKLNGWV